VPSSYVLTPNFFATMGSLTLVAYIARNLDGALGVENKWDERERNFHSLNSLEGFHCMSTFPFQDWLLLVIDV
jgi:hypothetical protein